MRRRGLVTIGNVASVAGVSATTVSHVLNGRASEARISTATRDRVLDAAGRLGYAPNHAARALRRRRTGSVTVLLWRLASPFFAEIAHGVRNVARRHGYHVGVIDAGAVDEDVEAEALAYLRTGISDGVVIATSTHRHRPRETDAILALIRDGIPAALVLDQSPDPAVPALDIDNGGGGVLATRHLLGLGHRRVAHFTFADVPLTRDESRTQATRYWGYRRALDEAGVGFDPRWVLVGGREVEGGREMAHAFLERFPDRVARPTAVFAFNDRTALGAIRGFYEAGLRVPDDVALVGFHGIASGLYSTPALTSVEHPRVELGEMAAESLFALLEGGSVDTRDRIIPVSLAVRESCGALPPGSYRPADAPARAPSGTAAEGAGTVAASSGVAAGAAIGRCHA